MVPIRTPARFMSRFSPGGECPANRLAFVQAMGLEIRAIFPDGVVKIEQLSALASREEHLVQTASSSR